MKFGKISLQRLIPRSKTLITSQYVAESKSSSPFHLPLNDQMKVVRPFAVFVEHQPASIRKSGIELHRSVIACLTKGA